MFNIERKNKRKLVQCCGPEFFLSFFSFPMKKKLNIKLLLYNCTDTFDINLIRKYRFTYR